MFLKQFHCNEMIKYSSMCYIVNTNSVVIINKVEIARVGGSHGFETFHLRIYMCAKFVLICNMQNAAAYSQFGSEWTIFKKPICATQVFRNFKI